MPHFGWRHAVIVALLVAVATSIPYATLWWRTPVDHVYLGLKPVNSADHLTYAAWMIQAERGELLFKNGSIPGQLQTTTSESTRSLTVSNQNELIISFYREAIDLYGLVINSNLQRSPPTGDAFGFFRAGHEVVQILDANIWYHSDGDLPDSMYPSGLERATRLYAYVLNRLDQADRIELE